MSYSIIILYKNNKSGENTIVGNPYVTKIVTNAITYCHNQVGKQYVRESLEERADMVYISKNSRGEIRGFASVIIGKDTHNKTYYYIDLICNAKEHSMKLRSDISRIRASLLMNKIIYDAKKQKVKYIKLKALESVISYYNKLYGFNFKNKIYSRKEKQREAKVISELYHIIKESRITDNEKMIEDFIKSKREFIKAVEGYYTEEDRRERPTEIMFSDRIHNGFTMYKPLIDIIRSKTKSKTKSKTRSKTRSTKSKTKSTKSKTRSTKSKTKSK